jgi:hypothetical protein
MNDKWWARIGPTAAGIVPLLALLAIGAIVHAPVFALVFVVGIVLVVATRRARGR